MKPSALPVISILVAIGAVGCATKHTPRPDSSDAEALAFAYLSTEVPAWHREHACFSCHNNGDGAAALLFSSSNHPNASDSTLKDTLHWLNRPQVWHENKGDPAYSDFKLARIQFGRALLIATQLGHIKDRGPLREAAGQIARDQDPDGAWRIEDDSSPGSPVTYGNPLATVHATALLASADASRFKTNINAASVWLSELPLRNVPSAAAVVLGLCQLTPDNMSEPVEQAIAYLHQAQSQTTGGWGPYRGAPAEPFDTALAISALWIAPRAAETEARIRLGRSFLLSEQLPGGGWPETTRPTNGESYAQHISTTAWALSALVSTSSPSNALLGNPPISGSDETTRTRSSPQSVQ